VREAGDRATLPRMVQLHEGERIPGEVIDPLLAGARTEERSLGPAGCWRSDQAAGRADDGGRADRSSRL
jgi:hypothetical protein